MCLAVLSIGATCGSQSSQSRNNGAVTVKLTAKEKVKVSVRTDTCDGKEIASFTAEPGTRTVTAPVSGAGIGKHAVYFAFSAETNGSAAEMDRFTFD